MGFTVALVASLLLLPLFVQGDAEAAEALPAEKSRAAAALPRPTLTHIPLLNNTAVDKSWVDEPWGIWVIISTVGFGCLWAGFVIQVWRTRHATSSVIDNRSAKQGRGGGGGGGKFSFRGHRRTSLVEYENTESSAIFIHDGGGVDSTRSRPQSLMEAVALMEKSGRSRQASAAHNNTNSNPNSDSTLGESPTAQSGVANVSGSVNQFTPNQSPSASAQSSAVKTTRHLGGKGSQRSSQGGRGEEQNAARKSGGGGATTSYGSI